MNERRPICEEEKIVQMSDLDIAVENILDEDDDVELEKEQDAMDGVESSAKNLQIKSLNLLLVRP